MAEGGEESNLPMAELVPEPGPLDCPILLVPPAQEALSDHPASSLTANSSFPCARWGYFHYYAGPHLPVCLLPKGSSEEAGGTSS